MLCTPHGTQNRRPVFFAQVDSDMPAKGRTADADIDRDVTHPAPQNNDKLPLRLRILQMQAAEHAAPTRQVVFDERPRDPQRRVAIRPEALAEETPLVAEHLGSMISTSEIAVRMTFMSRRA
jgi:hypothetical protein